jgi:uncharacterized protein YkwD
MPCRRILGAPQLHSFEAIPSHAFVTDLLTMPAWAWRLVVTLAATACALALPVTADSTPNRASSAHSALEASVVGEINAVRARHGLDPLRANGGLASAAGVHAQAMAQHGFFSHESADGSPFWKRVSRYYGLGSFSHWAVGENLLWASPNIVAARAVRMWMDSPPHRQNLLSAKWREVGLSAVHVDSAPGTFNGLEVTIMAAEFGVRR